MTVLAETIISPAKIAGAPLTTTLSQIQNKSEAQHQPQEYLEYVKRRIASAKQIHGFLPQKDGRKKTGVTYH
jgi:hypothetical protein